MTGQLINRCRLSQWHNLIVRDFQQPSQWDWLGELASWLMWHATNGAFDETPDGIMPGWRREHENQVECAGIFTTLGEHLVWPVRVFVRVDPVQRDIVDGTVKFGSCSWLPRKYGSAEHRALAAKIAADDQYDTDWMRVFVLEEAGWQIALPDYVEIN